MTQSRMGKWKGRGIVCEYVITRYWKLTSHVDGSGLSSEIYASVFCTFDVMNSPIILDQKTTTSTNRSNFFGGLNVRNLDRFIHSVVLDGAS